jgi:hypothetical protein
MNGIKFFLEYENKTEKNKGTRKNPGNHSGNVVAVLDDTLRINKDGAHYDAIGAVFFTRNSGVGSTSVHNDYLREKCKRISEKQAREIHPSLFSFLDM